MGFNHNLSFHILNTILASLVLFECVQGCIERERFALLDFKQSFASFPQNNDKLSSWSSSEDENTTCCDWEGILCDDQTRHVISLDLSWRELQSSHLRPSLRQLQHLTSLDLRRNNLAMRIPNFFGSFSRLTYLDLSDAGFFGTVPPQLGNLSKIQTLSLSGNDLSIDNLQWLSHLSCLESLDMSFLNFSSEARDWVSVIPKLPNLSTFQCYSCHFLTVLEVASTSIVHYDNSSSSLQQIHLDQSLISASSLLSLLANNTPNLLILSLSELELQGPFPDIFHGMTSLDRLHISDNHLHQGIFSSIGNLCNLTTLYASGCVTNESLANIFQALSGCASRSLEWLDLSHMNLTGTIPPMLNFQSLHELYLSFNWLHNFQNTLPIFPPNLWNLNLGDNNLNGVLSDQHFTNVSQLDYLFLSNNPNLTVTFTKSMFVGLYLHLRSCNLGPNFPLWLLSQNMITLLDISNSKISGTLPIMFWRNIISSSLSYLNLSSNNFYGTIPNIHYHLSLSAQLIDLSSNAFNGFIPFFLFMTTELDLSKNNFHGFASIPNSCNLSLQNPMPLDPRNRVDLSDNVLSGPLPYWFGFKPLIELVLANNNLSGKISSSIGHPNLYVLNLNNNSFSGPLPYLLKKCGGMRILDLGGNAFYGNIPSWIGDHLTNAGVLSLRYNRLTGILPTSFCHLSSLQILDISHNLLSGSIPSCIHNFTAMAHDVESSLEVDYNRGVYITNFLPNEWAESFFSAHIKWKSKIWEFESTLHLVKLIDLSSNNLSGEIPKALTSLVDLDSIDLTCNSLQGSIPQQIGQLKSLEYFNLSHNRLYGQIPASLAEISSLGMLDVSHNNLSGRIPKGTQLQSFNSSAYAANPGLCDSPLEKCPGDKDDHRVEPSRVDDNEVEEKWTEKQCLYGGLGTGFAFGLVGTLCSLNWITKFRHAFFQFATELGEWIMLAVALGKARLSRKLGFK